MYSSIDRMSSGDMSWSFPIGKTPSHRAARRKGGLFGQKPASQIGMRGCCRGVGRKRALSMVKCSPLYENGSPDQSPVTTSIASRSEERRVGKSEELGRG